MNKNKLKKSLKYLFDTLFSPLAFLLGWIIPKKNNLVLFMGRNQSGFLDNIKYLYLYLYQNEYNEKYDLIYMGHNDIAYKELEEKGFKFINFPSIKAYWLLARANVVITDNAHWTTHNRYNISIRSKKIQLWHGIGFKDIRVSDKKFLEASKGLKGFITRKLQGQLAVYDTFISTSDFYSREVFEPAFSPKEMVELGYPRNDVFINEDDMFIEHHIAVNMDMDMYYKVQELKRNGTKIVLYAPTFRKTKEFNISSEFMDFQRLSDFGAENNIVFIFKLHPLPTCTIKFENYTNVFEYNNRKEIYPLFKYIDLLITDYSSIYMDYLLLDRPCIFFWYDYEYYTKECRGIRADFVELSPGEKCYTQDELYTAVYQILIKNNDLWVESRESVRKLAWKYQDGKSCERVWNYVEGKYLKCEV